MYLCVCVLGGVLDLKLAVSRFVIASCHGLSANLSACSALNLTAATLSPAFKSLACGAVAYARAKADVFCYCFFICRLRDRLAVPLCVRLERLPETALRLFVTFF